MLYVHIHMTIHCAEPYLPTVRIAVLCVDALVVDYVFKPTMCAATIAAVVTIRHCMRVCRPCMIVYIYAYLHVFVK